MGDWIQWIRGRVGHDLIFVPSAVGWVGDENGRVLLQKRAADEEAWGFPGGILELGESFEDGAIREIREETGLEVTPVRLLGLYSKYFETCPNGDQCQTLTAIFEMTINGGSLKIDNYETFDLRFFDRDALPRLHSPQHRDMVEDILRGGQVAFR